MMRPVGVFALLVTGWAVLAPGRRAAAQDVADTAGAGALVRWAARHATTLSPLDQAGANDDLTALDGLARRARVIAVGESDHSVHEFFRLRLRITKYLVERREIAAVAVETGMPEARAVDAWLVGDSAEVPPLRGLLHYGYGQSAEMRELLTWLHDWNARQPRARRVRFYGLDLARSGGGSFLPAIEPVWAYLDTVDAAYARESRGRIEAIVRAIDRSGFWSSRPAYDSLSAGARDTLRAEADALAARFTARRDAYLARSTPESYSWAARLAQVVRQTDVYLRDRDTPANPRDPAMAENLIWVLEREGSRGRVLLLEHNLHIARAPIEGPMVVARMGHPAQVETLGRILGETLGRAYVTIGTTHDLGAAGAEAVHADPASLDGTLARVGKPLFLLDLRDPGMPAQARAWLARPHRMRALGTWVDVRPGVAFDALVFVDSIRRSDRLAPTGAAPRSNRLRGRFGRRAPGPRGRGGDEQSLGPGNPALAGDRSDPERLRPRSPPIRQGNG